MDLLLEGFPYLSFFKKTGFLRKTDIEEVEIGKQKLFCVVYCRKSLSFRDKSNFLFILFYFYSEEAPFYHDDKLFLGKSHS